MVNGQAKRKDTRSLTLEIYQEHPDWNAREIYDRYLILLGNPDDAVTLNAVQKHVQAFKAVDESDELRELAADWHTGLADKYNIPPAAIAKIFELQTEGVPCDVRMARWVSKLSLLPLSLEWLGVFALEYSAFEWKAQLKQEPLPFDTTEIDNRVVELLKKTKDGEQ